MADIQANIILTTTGGSEAAAEVDKAGKAIQNVTSSSANMQSQFQHKFQHLGLMLFAGDALRAAGLGNHVRDVIGIMNSAIMAGGTAFGAMTGPIFLAVTALAAFAGIAAKVIQHNQANTEELVKLADASMKSAEATRKDVDVISTYIEKGGRLTAMERQEYAAKKNLADATARLAQLEMMQAIPAINQHIVALQAQRAHIVAQSATVNALADVWLVKYIPVFRIAAEIAKHFTASGDDLKRKLGEIDVELQKQILQLKKYESGIVDLRHEDDMSWDRKLKNLQNQRDTEKKIYDEIKAQHALRRKEMDTLIAMSVKDHQKAYEQERQFATQVAGQIGSAFGNAFAQTIMEGKDFTEQMQRAFKQMAEQIIADIVRMIVEWEILMALGFPAGGAAGGLGGLMGGFATGGSRMVDKPTLFMAGEAGPEVATFTPVSSAGGQSSVGGGGVTNIKIDVTANGVNDPQELARLVGPALIQEIRGMGQLNYVRR